MNDEPIGSSLASFLDDRGIPEEVTTQATLEALAWLGRHDLLGKSLDQSKPAEAMGTSRSQVSRLLKAYEPDIRVSTLEKAATALGRMAKIELVEAISALGRPG